MSIYKLINTIKKAIFLTRWNYKNRNWKDTRQKRKALEKDLLRYLKG